MNALELYERLERDFIISSLSDRWAEYMQPISDFLTDTFKQRSMGLVCDNSGQVGKVYTAVFPTNEVMQSILDKNEVDVMLFVHHPMIWDIRKAPSTFQQMDRGLLQQFRERRISIYNLHVPLDNYGEYSTSVTLAKTLGIEPEKPFAYYFGALCGVFGKTGFSRVPELKKKFESWLGHRVSLYQYGTDEIKNGMVAVAAGGGNNIEVLVEVAAEGINTFLTGVTILNDYTRKVHEYARDKGINILGGTHYSTERPACQEMCSYFKDLGLPSEFIEGTPILEDL